ncbi:MAG: flagellar M-ring protein FliF [Hyphomicrobiales bacterium]|jgi:flagellar M-ring protein FliF
MISRENAQKLWQDLLELGARRLIALAFVGVTVFTGVGLGAYFLSRPELEVLYTGLSRDDINRMGAALRDADIKFDVNSAGDAISVRRGQTVQARVMLAEKGLPNSSNAGYELFDKVGSLGLTSFMQEVTRVRALEGELARTIQVMKGVKAARVHVVLGERGSFRRERQPPSASVVVRGDVNVESGTPQAIRYLVAAAVPGMVPDRVNVMNAEGTLMLAGDDASTSTSARMTTLEKFVNRSVQESIRKTLIPYLGIDNFEVSVAAKLNTDRRQTNETTYDPESRAERSVRTIRENEKSQNAARQTPTTVEQNVPNNRPEASGGTQSAEEKNKREDVTNYEMSTKTVTTVSDGYNVSRLSIAVLINRPRLIATLGGEATATAIESKVAEIEQIAAMAAGIDKQRGDQIRVSAVEFMENGRDIEPIPQMGLSEILARQLGNIINAAAILLMAVLLIWFGLRPAINSILEARAAERAAEVQKSEFAALADAQSAAAALQAGAIEGDEPNLVEDLTSKMKRAPLKRLEQIIQLNEKQAADVLRRWTRGEEAA